MSVGHENSKEVITMNNRVSADTVAELHPLHAMPVASTPDAAIPCETSEEQGIETTVDRQPPPRDDIAIPFISSLPLPDWMMQLSLHKLQREEVLIESLKFHPMNAVLFPSASIQKDEELKENIRQNGQLTPVLLAGDGCSSEPGTVLSGHRRVQACKELGHDKIIGIRVDNLEQGQEVALIIACNQADLTTRDVTDEDQYKLEEGVRRAIIRGLGCSEPQGQESTVKGRQGQRGDTQGRTDELVAKRLGVTVNAVRQRKKIFGSSLATRELLDALNRGQLERSNAFILVTEIEKKFKDTDLSGPSARDALSQEVNKRVEKAIQSRHTRGRRKKAEDVLPSAPEQPKPPRPKKASKVQDTTGLDSVFNTQDETEVGANSISPSRDDASNQVKRSVTSDRLVFRSTAAPSLDTISDQAVKMGPRETVVRIIALLKALESNVESMDMMTSEEARAKLGRGIRKTVESAQEVIDALLEEARCKTALRQTLATSEAT